MGPSERSPFWQDPLLENHEEFQDGTSRVLNQVQAYSKSVALSFCPGLMPGKSLLLGG